MKKRGSEIAIGILTVLLAITIFIPITGCEDPAEATTPDPNHYYHKMGATNRDRVQVTHYHTNVTPGSHPNLTTIVVKDTETGQEWLIVNYEKEYLARITPTLNAFPSSKAEAEEIIEIIKEKKDSEEWEW